MTARTDTTEDVFAKKLAECKQQIDADIVKYSKQLQKETLQKYGANSRLAADAFLAILARGGKRIRGALTIVGYEMAGGKDKQMILQAARAIEMIHAYLLIMDDIQDRSETRRGGMTAHVALSHYHRDKHLSGNAEHFGISISLNAMGIGNHEAQIAIASLDVDGALKIKALELLNKAIVVTAHGQTNDIINEVDGNVTVQDVDNVMEWKTAHYTFLNPLTFGMTLAGADDTQIQKVKKYALNAGRAFQITDDILGVFGEEFTSGKSPMDDIKEGKRTLLTIYALENADRADKNFLIQMLGNQKLTQAEFQRCKDILTESGALEYAQNEADRCIKQAIDAINNQANNWHKASTDFLVGLVRYLAGRSA